MTLRDLSGRVVDIFLNPINSAGDDMIVFPSITAVGVVDFRASNIDFLNNLKNSSEDFYTTVKTIYIQRRNSDINNTSFNQNQNDPKPEFINFDE
jgi:phospholipid-binding lipoprotein MlaA